MEGVEESSLLYDDDFYISKSRGKQKQLNYQSSNIDKFRSNLLKKVHNLPIKETSKITISKLCISHKLKDIVKVLKVSKNSVTIHAKANAEHKAFSELEGCDDVIVKVFIEQSKADNEYFAYSMQCIEDERLLSKYHFKPVFNGMAYSCEPLVLLRVDNVVIMKMIDSPKKIEEVIENSSESLSGMYGQILKGICYLVRRSYEFWRNDLCSMKNIVRSNDKWIFLDVRLKDSNNYNTCDDSNLTKTIISITDLFRSYGMSIDDLQKLFTLHFQPHRWSWTDMVYRKVFELYFDNPDEFHKKTPRRYMKSRFPKQPKVSKKSK